MMFLDTWYVYSFLCFFFFFRVSLRRQQSCTLFTNSFYEYIRLVLGLMSAYKSDEKIDRPSLSQLTWNVFGIFSFFHILIHQCYRFDSNNRNCEFTAFLFVPTVACKTHMPRFGKLFQRFIYNAAHLFTCHLKDF